MSRERGRRGSNTLFFDEEAFLTSFLFSDKTEIIIKLLIVFVKSANYENDILVRYFVSPSSIKKLQLQTI